MHKYHGTHKLNDMAELANFDIVFTTYHTLAAEFSRTNSNLHGITWYRIVLDEGKQPIIQVSSQQANVCKLTISVTRGPRSSEQPQHYQRISVGVLLAHQ